MSGIENFMSDLRKGLDRNIDLSLNYLYALSTNKESIDSSKSKLIHILESLVQRQKLRPGELTVIREFLRVDKIQISVSIREEGYSLLSFDGISSRKYTVNNYNVDLEMLLDEIFNHIIEKLRTNETAQ